MRRNNGGDVDPGDAVSTVGARGRERSGITGKVMAVLEDVAARNEPRLSPGAAFLRWAEQDVVFDMQSLPEVIAEARRVFAAGDAICTGAPARTWSVERRNGSHPESAWRVSGSSQSDSMIPVIADSVQTALLHVELDALNFLLRYASRSIGVHAALLSKDGRGVLIVGPSLAGKSTLATALWRSGWSLMSDDLVFVDPRRRTASPGPRRVALRFDSRELIGSDLWDAISATPSCVRIAKGLFFHPHELTGGAKLRETTLVGIFFLARQGARVTNAETRAINPARGALALVPHSLNVRTLPFVESMGHVTPLAESVPMFDLGRGSLAAMIAAIEARLG